jgi:hypothetical protein
MVFNSAFGRRPNALGRGASWPDSGNGIPGTTLATSKPKISLPTRQCETKGPFVWAESRIYVVMVVLLVGVGAVLVTVH